jgi:curli biogenesis system outer membrane secretion channel CsgG
MLTTVANAFLASVLLFASVAFSQDSAAPAQNPASPPNPSAPAMNVANKMPSASDIVDVDAELLRVKRIFVESFGDDATSRQIQAMVVSSLTESKKFIVTENKEKADAILKGSSLEKTSQELHSSSESTAAGGAAGGHSGSVSGSFINGSGSVSGTSHGGFVSRAMAIEDSSTSTETINDVRIAVRLVDTNGDVIWATTQESKGAKYKGSSADVADKVVKQLLRDREKLQKNLQ